MKDFLTIRNIHNKIERGKETFNTRIIIFFFFPFDMLGLIAEVSV